MPCYRFVTNIEIVVMMCLEKVAKKNDKIKIVLPRNDPILKGCEIDNSSYCRT